MLPQQHLPQQHPFFAKPSTKKAAAKKKIPDDRTKKGRRSADSTEESGSTPPPGQMRKVPRGGQTGVSPRDIRSSPQTWEGEGGRTGSRHQPIRTPTPESSKHKVTPDPDSDQFLESRVKKVIQSNPELHGKTPDNPYTPSFVPVPSTHDQDMGRESCGTAASPHGRASHELSDIFHSDKTREHAPSPCPHPQAKTPVSRDSITQTTPKKATSSKGSTNHRSTSNQGFPQQDSFYGSMPYQTEEYRQWVEQTYAMFGCKGCHSKPPKGMRGMIKASSDASSSTRNSSTRASSRPGVDDRLRGKLQNIIADGYSKKMGEELSSSLEQALTCSPPEHAPGPGNASHVTPPSTPKTQHGEGSSTSAMSSDNISKIVDSVMSEIAKCEPYPYPYGGYPYGYPPYRQQHGHADPYNYMGQVLAVPAECGRSSTASSSSMVSTQRPNLEYGTPDARRSHLQNNRAKIPSPRSAFSSKTAGSGMSGVSSSSCDSIPFQYLGFPPWWMMPPPPQYAAYAAAYYGQHPHPHPHPQPHPHPHSQDPSRSPSA
eukprot:TRINITY_DN1091_c1_g1_i1.p1 TRINITY_DN1091_c1_g1~~TRINITY_DN1091_c1_g1_i1.p1  ORF type:complete len:542 (+),score=41.67 TRINITY_DN1091_c1_g1_i1:115-1740(+)